MITEIYISSDSDDKAFTNGINIQIQRVNDEMEAQITLVDDGGKCLMQFNINFDELKKGIEKLSI